ncbi:MAG TPA: tetratricopeptide repeat protein [Candidatus Koribacter sp.]|jgi:tetratricopeptide (TPR) repeat protein
MDPRNDNTAAVTSGFGTAAKSQLDATYAGPARGPGASLELGSRLGGRYEILQLLGEGGMGAVYKARDLEVDKIIALKVIRPDLANDPEILQRFKQELLTAREVTHRNVIRIYDLGEAENVKFITMEFVPGKDLRSVLREQGKLSPGAAVAIMQQIVQGLDAAHQQGVIHRDLKPGNIMQDDQGRIVVMDFGLARTLGNSDGMTQTGMMLGTFEYMSPEQAQAQKLDARSDLFTVGLIFYELLTGNTPYRADSALASLLKRTQEPAVPPSSVDGAVPKEVSRIVCKCLERDAKLRYQSATELLADLKRWEGGEAAGSLNFEPVRVWGRDWPWHIIGSVAAAIVLVVLGYVFRAEIFAPRAKPAAVSTPAVSLAIVPFRNASGDGTLDWLGGSVAEMLSTEIGQSKSLRTVSSDRVHQVVSDLQIKPSTQVDASMLNRIAEFSSADILVSGQYARFGDVIRLDATLRDLKNDRSVALKVEAASEKEIPQAVNKLAQAVRQNLALSSDVMKELEASSFAPSSTSPVALREYDEGLQLHREGKNLGALKHLEAATQADPQFALAYSALANAYSELGYDSDAERASRKAADLAQKLPTAEKYLIEANHARLIKDTNKAISSYQVLAARLPGNTDIQYELGSLYISTGNYDKAREQFTKILHEDPKNIKALWQMGAVEIMSDHADAAIDPLTRGMTLAIQVGNDEQKALVMQALGVAYRLLNKPEDAMRNYQQAMEINKKLGLKRNLAGNLTEIAVVQTMMGKPDQALKSYNDALSIQQDIGAKKESGDTLMDIGVVYENIGDNDKALQNYKDALQIQRDSNDQNYEALCLNNIGTVYLAKGDTENALTYLQQALQLRQKLNVSGDIAETLSHLGDVYSAINQYESGLSSYISSLDLYRKAADARGAAVVSHSMGMVFLKQGRIDAAITSLQDAEKNYRSVGDRGVDMGETLIDLALALAQSGKLDEPDKLLAEATGISADLKNESLRALALNAKGDLAFYRADLKSARQNYEEAQRTAAKGKQADTMLLIKLNLSAVSVGEGRPASAVRDLPDLIQQANRLGLGFNGLSASLDLAQAMINGKDYVHARQALEEALSKSEKWGIKPQTARIHYLLGTALRLSGNGSDAAEQYRLAKNLYDDLQKQSGTEHLLDRADLKTIYADCNKYQG